MAASSCSGDDLEMLVDAGGDHHRYAVGEHHHVRVGHPIRRRDDDFVAGVEQGLGQVEKTLFAAHRYQDLRRRICQAVLAGEFGDDGLLQLGGAAHVGVLGETVLDGLDGGLFNMVGGVEIRFARAQTDDVFSGGAQGGGAGGDGEGG